MVSDKQLTDYVCTEVTNSIKVSVACEPLVSDSDPVQNIFAFAYTVTIENLGEMAAQLLERHWIIMCDGEQIAEVVGPGVVGIEPTIEPGASFQYSSGAVIQNPSGEMYGSYTFHSQNGEYFAVAIPKFDLMYPVIIH